MTHQDIIQAGIILTGVPAIWLLNNGYKFGSVLGLIGQFFWFWMAIDTHSWGVFILCLFYTYSWGCGVMKFIDDMKNKRGLSK